MPALPVSPEQGRASCADQLHLVDASYASPGSTAAIYLRETLCPECPIREHCETWAMTHPEAGVWGGMSPRQRTIKGAPARHDAGNFRL